MSVVQDLSTSSAWNPLTKTFNHDVSSELWFHLTAQTGAESHPSSPSRVLRWETDWLGKTGIEVSHDLHRTSSQDPVCRTSQGFPWDVEGVNETGCHEESTIVTLYTPRTGLTAPSQSTDTSQAVSSHQGLDPSSRTSSMPTRGTTWQVSESQVLQALPPAPSSG